MTRKLTKRLVGARHYCMSHLLTINLVLIEILRSVRRHSPTAKSKTLVVRCNKASNTICILTAFHQQPFLETSKIKNSQLTISMESQSENSRVLAQSCFTTTGISLSLCMILSRVTTESLDLRLSLIQWLKGLIVQPTIQPLF